ncbi:MAG: hypothetical protein AAFP68_16985 [Pseudomonadota bacterium]
MTMDDNALELLERRLSERIETRVRGRLFRFYGAVGGIAIGVISFFGYNIVSSLEDTAKKFAENAVAEAVRNADQAARDASKQTVKVSERLTALDEFQQRRIQMLIESEEQLAQAQAKIDRLSNSISGRIDSIDRNIQETEAQVTAQSQRLQAKDVAGVDYVDEVAVNVANLAAQVAILEAQLREVREKAPTGIDYQVGAADPAQIEQAAQSRALPAPVLINPVTGLATKIEQPVQPFKPLGDTTVYVQFAGVARDVMTALTDRLDAPEFKLPSAERTKHAAGTHDIRYFFDTDFEQAEKLRDLMNGVLAKSGYRAEIELRDLTAYKGAKPSPGTVELWLEPVKDQ